MHYAFDKQGWHHFRMTASLDILPLTHIYLQQTGSFFLHEDLLGNLECCQYCQCQYWQQYHWSWKPRNLKDTKFFFFFFSWQKLYYTVMPSLNKLLDRIQNEKLCLLVCRGNQRSRFMSTAAYRKGNTDHKLCSCGCHIGHVVSDQLTNEILLT